MILTRAEIVDIYVDQTSGVPVLLLQDVESNQTLPILIAPLEASMIAIELEGKEPVRPLTHDLLLNIIKALSCEIDSISITDLKNNIYYANINITKNNNLGEMTVIDSRPSDAIALAIRAKIPIYVAKKLFAMHMGMKKASQEADEETLKEVLENFEIEDAGGKIM